MPLALSDLVSQVEQRKQNTTQELIW